MHGLQEIKEMNKADKATRYRIQRDRLAQALARVMQHATGLPGDVANLAARAAHLAEIDSDEEDDAPEVVANVRYPRKAREFGKRDGNPPNIVGGVADDAGKARDWS